ncbi:MAG: hypothetical protein HC785_27805 [Calothrix sp. CSU_2_0]|nr:hypothetical protein [Calothrix sp. CSU_2_0]
MDRIKCKSNMEPHPFYSPLRRRRELDGRLFFRQSTLREASYGRGDA